ncbi:hypothetical protein PAHAL_3G496300 [Panicum hallii]|uniref:Uncharacterized protein n=1 Tax=Panicum hallii TaxID=206008 RepID=A0A2T8KM49_9POAL|nr:hypothetical protein PAHAL_3G496300 [Panicum hallii]
MHASSSPVVLPVFVRSPDAPPPPGSARSRVVVVFPAPTPQPPGLACFLLGGALACRAAAIPPPAAVVRDRIRLPWKVDLHTKCTDHKDFADKPVEAAKPIDLEAPPKSASSSEAIYGRRCPGLGK